MSFLPKTWRFQLPDDRTTQLAIGVPAAIVGGYVIYKWVSSSMHTRNLRRKIRARNQLREQQIQQVREFVIKLDPQIEKKISKMRIEEVLDALKSNEITCTDVLMVYYQKSLVAHEKTNCITEYLLQAVQDAKKFDQLAKDSQYEKPPLFGLPISIKANITLKGHDVIRGYAQDLEQPAERDSILVRQLRELGAIPFALTNVPQSLLSFSCQNAVFGTTSHPLSKKRTSGGSSGGEGALIGCNGSLLGIGSDIGGSIRIPAAFCGTVGFKPTSKRFSNADSKSSIPGRSHVFGSIGPLSQTVSGSVILLQTMWSNNWIHEHDPYIPPVNFNTEAYESVKRLRIGYYDFDGYIRPLPSMKRAVHETKDRLKALGHELIPIVPPRVDEAFLFYLKAVLLDNGKFIIDQVKQDICIPALMNQLGPLKWPFWLRDLVSFLVRPLSSRSSAIIANYQRDLTSLRENCEKIEEYWAEWKKLIRENQLDCFICPSFTTPAMKHEEPYLLISAVTYTALFNLLDYPAGVLNVSKVTQEDVNQLESYKSEDFLQRKMVNSAKETLDFPVGVQVVSVPFHDEVVLRVMREIEDSIGSSSN
ncbi:hypothetical protein M3Y94_00878000 [Aphelenchoides besseyi]|nr:hypothetical protein M3Y94_00878000 [Aphelenchoides besseyi]KAI6226586.1 Amidase domain-containing protein [Aphelenchoides besseyi]